MKKVLLLLSVFICSISFGQNVHNYFQPAAKLKATAATAFGDSYTTCNGCSPTSAGYAPTTAANYGLSFTNYAVGATGVWSFAKNHLIQINPGHSNLSIVGMMGLNDVRRNGSPALTMNKVANCTNAIIANQFLKNFYPADTTWTQITRSGSWSIFTGLALGAKTNKGAFSVVTGDSIVYRFTDTTVVVGLFGADGVTNHYATFNVLVDNALYGSFTENGQSDAITDGTYDNSRIPMALIITGLSNTAHKITLINTNGAGSLPFVVDYFGSLVDPSVAMPIVFMEAPHLDSTGYVVAPQFGNDVAINQSIKTLDSTVAIFLNGSIMAANYPVAVAKTSAYFNPSLLGGDHIHPTNPGYAQIAQSAVAALNTQTPPTPKGQMFFILNNKPYFNDANGYSVPIQFGTPLPFVSPANLSATISIGSAVTSSTTGSIFYADGSSNLAQDNANLFYDASNKRLSIGKTAPTYTLDLQSPAALPGIHLNNAGTDIGLYIMALGNASYFMSGSSFDGVNFKAKSTTSAQLLMGNGVTQFVSDLALTPGNTYTPTERGRITTLGNLLFGTTSEYGGAAGTRGVFKSAGGSPVVVTSTTTGGMYFTSTATNVGYVFAGSHFDGANFIADAVTSSGFGANNGVLQFFSNTGLTIGNSFSANEIGRFASNGHLLLNTTTDNGLITAAGVIAPEANNTRDLGTSSFAFQNLFVQSELATGAKSNGHVNVSGTGTYSALGTDYTIEFTGTTATLAYPTVNLVNGRHLNIINYGSGALTIPSTKTGNATTVTTLASNGRMQVEYDLANTTWIQIN